MVADYKAATFVRVIDHGEKIEDLVDDLKFRAWQGQVEHMVLQLDTGERLIVKGGRKGIDFYVKGTGDERTCT